MNLRVVYQLPDRPVSILIPSDKKLSVQQIAEKDVPVGISFWIVSSEDIPEDRSMRNAWELDAEVMGVPDGVGGGDVQDQ